MEKPIRLKNVYLSKRMVFVNMDIDVISFMTITPSKFQRRINSGFLKILEIFSTKASALGKAD